MIIVDTLNVMKGRALEVEVVFNEKGSRTLLFKHFSTTIFKYL
jgi:hypothetical protein